MRLASLPLVLASLVALAACPGRGGGSSRPYPEPSVDAILARIAKVKAERASFTAESRMDYWLGNDRVKGDVLIMGKLGKKVRFNALSPAGGDVLVDMACDGSNFAYVDKQNNCQLTGPCNRNSIAQMLRVQLEPDDFLMLAMGVPPVLANPAGTVTWDGKGHEVVTLTSPEGTQTITLRLHTQDEGFDLVSSEVKDAAGNVVWSIENQDFEEASDAADDHPPHRLPTKTRFKSPQEKADLVVDWMQRMINPALDDAKFVVQVPAGLPRCGGGAP